MKHNKYLGPAWLPKLNFLYRREFQQAAKIHDRHYRKQEISRKKADKHFKDMCLQVANKADYPKKRWLAIWAMIYYTLLRMFGWTSYFISSLY